MSALLATSSRGGVEGHARNSGNAEAKCALGPVAPGASRRSELSQVGIKPGPRETFSFKNTARRQPGALADSAPDANTTRVNSQPLTMEK